MTVFAAAACPPFLILPMPSMRRCRIWLSSVVGSFARRHTFIGLQHRRNQSLPATALHRRTPGRESWIPVVPRHHTHPAVLVSPPLSRPRHSLTSCRPNQLSYSSSIQSIVTSTFRLLLHKRPQLRISARLETGAYSAVTPHASMRR